MDNYSPPESLSQQAAKDNADEEKEQFNTLKAALDDSSEKNRNFLLAFLVLQIYLFAATYSTTDAQLFLINEQQTFSLFSFKMPIYGFYWLAVPVLFAFHYNVLLNLQEHSAKLYRWLNHPVQQADQHHDLLSPYIFNTWAKGPFSKSTAKEFHFGLTKVIVLLLFTIAPLGLLVFVMWQLADLQDPYLAAWHSLWVFSDTLLIAWYWPRIIRPDDWRRRTTLFYELVLMKTQLYKTWYLACAIIIVSLRLCLLYLAIAQPQRLTPWLANPYAQYMVPRLVVSGLKLNKLAVDRPKPAVSNTSFDTKVSIPVMIPIKECSPDNNYQTVGVSKRQFNLIDLTDTTLCNVDFSNSQLKNANLTRATFSGRFNAVDLGSATFYRTRIQRGTSMVSANLSSASIRLSIANGVDFTLADLSGAKVVSSEFAAASFLQANLTSAEFARTIFHQTEFIATQLYGTLFIQSDLIGVDLRFAKTLTDSNLDGSRVKHCLLDKGAYVDGLKQGGDDMVWVGNSNCQLLHENLTGGELVLYIKEITAMESSFDGSEFMNFRSVASSFADLVNRLIAGIEFGASKAIDLSQMSLATIPTELLGLTRLKKLVLDDNKLTPAQISITASQMPQLSLLSLRNNQFSNIPDSIGQLTQLRKLDLSKNELNRIPDTIGLLSRLETLWLAGNHLSKLPGAIEQLYQLKTLGLRGNQLSQLPEIIGQLSQLQYLDIGYNQLNQIPDTISELDNLEVLDLQHNNISVLPISIMKLTKIKRICLAGNPLKLLPVEFKVLTGVISFKEEPICYLLSKKDIAKGRLGGRLKVSRYDRLWLKNSIPP